MRSRLYLLIDRLDTYCLTHRVPTRIRVTVGRCWYWTQR